MKKIEVVAGIIYYENKILCMQRELCEELDMNAIVNEDNYFMTVDHFYPDKEVVMHAYKCKVETDKFNMKEHKDFKWLTLNELDSLDWAQADIPIKNKLIEEG